VLTTANFGFVEALGNWVCNLMKLNVRHFVIAALDAPTYEWGVVRGLPIFRWTLPGGDLPGAHRFGERPYETLTKAKPLVTRHLLTLGYSVFFVDADVVLFRDPLSLVDVNDRNTLWAQSDVPFATTSPIASLSLKAVPEDANRWVNSGFYYAPASPVCLSAFAKIAEALAGPTGIAADGDQPILNTVLCEPPHGIRAQGGLCIYTDPDTDTRLGVRCWPQLLAANGRTCVRLPHPTLSANRIDRRACTVADTHTLFEYRYNGLTPLIPGQAALHNNWITGKAAKIRRQRVAGLWWVDEATEVCPL
jgi:hypothetical protein